MNAVVHTDKMVRKGKTMTAVNGAIEAAEQGALVTVVGLTDGTQACCEEAVKSFQRVVKCGGYATAYEKHMPWVLRHEM